MDPRTPRGTVAALLPTPDLRITSTSQHLSKSLETQIMWLLLKQVLVQVRRSTYPFHPSSIQTLRHLDAALSASVEGILSTLMINFSDQGRGFASRRRPVRLEQLGLL
jgi:hypothetical protein